MTMPTCAIYARVSDESQLKGDSIEHQISVSREFARRRSLDGGSPWQVPDGLVYKDEGITGTTMVERPAVQKLISDARSGAFDVVLFKGISRFARDTVDSLVMLRTLLSSGVRVISLEENFDSDRDRAEFVFTIHSALAQAESEKTAIRVRVGVLEKAKRGRWNGRAPDGYVLNSETQKLEVDLVWAPVIGQIFQLYLAGYGCRSIADTFNNQRQFTKQGAFWSARNVLRILRNPVYAGDVVYGRHEKRQVIVSAESPFSRRKKAVPVQDKQQFVMRKNAHPSIVDRDVFERVQELLEARQTERGPTGKHHYFTRGKLRCRCNSGFTVKYNPSGRAYYRCLGQQDKGKTFCQMGYLRVDSLEEAVLARLRAEVLERLPLGDCKWPIPPERDRVLNKSREQELERQRRKALILFDKYTDGLYSCEEYGQMNTVLQNRITQLERTLTHVTSQPGSWPCGAIDLRDFATTRLSEYLTPNSPDRRLTSQLINRLIKEIQVLNVSPGNVELQVVYRFDRNHSL